MTYAMQTRFNYLTFIGSDIANIFTEYNQQDVAFHNLFISARRSTCSRRVFRPSSGPQNCTYSKSDVWLTVHRNSVWIRKIN